MDDIAGSRTATLQRDEGKSEGSDTDTSNSSRLESVGRFDLSDRLSSGGRCRLNPVGLLYTPFPQADVPNVSSLVPRVSSHRPVHDEGVPSNAIVVQKADHSPVKNAHTGEPDERQKLRSHRDSNSGCWKMIVTIRIQRTNHYTMKPDRFIFVQVCAEYNHTIAQVFAGMCTARTHFVL